MPQPLAAVQNEDPALSSGSDKVVMWSYPIVQDGLIYLVDVRNGLYILRYRGPCQEEIRGVDFLEGNSNLGDALRFERSSTRREYDGRCKDGHVARETAWGARLSSATAAPPAFPSLEFDAAELGRD
jgi:hypothetical protein